MRSVPAVPSALERRRKPLYDRVLPSRGLLSVLPVRPRNLDSIQRLQETWFWLKAPPYVFSMG